MTATKKEQLRKMALRLLLPAALLAVTIIPVWRYDDDAVRHMWRGILIGLVAAHLLTGIWNLLGALFTRDKPEVPGAEMGKLEIDRL
ncbi:MAG: hypothetical protein EOP85_23285 [Verrucomicrobiaceae bacterium]|nr:MAG: hypothetical protein EOP85_23285 [Verrucomicrobiaceae bacterium]